MKKRRFQIDSDKLILLKHIGVGVLVLSLVSLFITGVWHGSRLAFFTIDEIEVIGGQTIEHKKIHTLVNESLEGTYVGLVPKRFSWFYPQNDIAQKVDIIDRVHSVVVKKEHRKKVIVTFDEHIPDSLWCDEKECLFVDDAGYAFSHAPNLSGGSFLRFITLNKDISVGDTVSDYGSFSSLKETSRLLAAEGWFISQIEIDNVGDAFLSVVNGGELKITITDDPEKIVKNLLVILASSDFSHIVPGDFQYIDLRFGNKVFVNEEIATPVEEVTIEVASSTLSF
jgi:hypothetical protein